MSDSDKQALLNGTATIQTELEVINKNDDNTILTEENSVISWNHEDFRYVKDEGWIGQFVARQLTGELKNISDDFLITDKEMILRMGVKVGDNTTWYSLGNFLVTKVTDDEVGDKTSFEALDYTKKFNKLYEDNITYPCTALELAQNVCNQCGVTLGSDSFKNSNYIITGNPFTNGESCRDVMKAIGKLAFSWVRVDWDNKVYIDFTKETTVDTYNKANNSKYYNLKTQKVKFGPINRIVIGYSQIEGEKTYIENQQSIEQYGKTELTVYDNPLVYTQAQRESIIESARDLMGLEYMPLNTLTVGHPWLKGKELFEITDMENVTHTTIPFDRTIQYFGHIKTLINSSTPTRTENAFAYEAELAKNLLHTEIQVNKQAGEITSLVEQTVNANNPDSLASVLSKTIQNMYSIENLFQITGGDNLIKDSQLLLQDEGLWEYGNANSYNLFPGSDVYPSSSLYTTEYYYNESDYVGGYDATLMGKTVAIAKIGIANGKMKTSATNITGLILNTMYTLSFKITNDADTISKISLIGNGTVVYEETFDNVLSFEEKSISFIAQTSNYQLEIQSTSATDGHIYIYDLMLNKGDIQTWEPAAGELVSTVIKLSRLGIQVYSSSSKIATMMTSEGFNVYRYENGFIFAEDPITTFDHEGFKSKKGILEQLEIGDFDFKIVKYQSYDTLILYKKGSDD